MLQANTTQSELSAMRDEQKKRFEDEAKERAEDRKAQQAHSQMLSTQMHEFNQTFKLAVTANAPSVSASTSSTAASSTTAGSDASEEDDAEMESFVDSLSARQKEAFARLLSKKK